MPETLYRPIRILFLFSIVIIVSIAPVSGQVPPGGADAGGAAQGGDTGTAGAGGASGIGVQASSNIVVDNRNKSITITTTPSNHRKIEKLLEQISQDPLAGERVEVKEFTLLNITPEEFRELIRFHKPHLNPDDPRRLYIVPASDLRNSSLIPQTPTGTSVGTSGGGGAGGGADGGAGGAGGAGTGGP